MTPKFALVLSLLLLCQTYGYAQEKDKDEPLFKEWISDNELTYNDFIQFQKLLLEYETFRKNGLADGSLQKHSSSESREAYEESAKLRVALIERVKGNSTSTFVKSLANTTIEINKNSEPNRTFSIESVSRVGVRPSFYTCNGKWNCRFKEELRDYYEEKQTVGTDTNSFYQFLQEFESRWDSRYSSELMVKKWEAERTYWKVNPDNKKTPLSQKIVQSVGRISVFKGRTSRGKHKGTAFIIAKSPTGAAFVMTAKHVVLGDPILGTKSFGAVDASGKLLGNGIKKGWKAKIDFVQESCDADPLLCDVDSVVFIHNYMDVAVLRIKPRKKYSKEFSRLIALRLSKNEIKQKKIDIAVIGYPGSPPSRRLVALAQNVFSGEFGDKHFSPGRLLKQISSAVKIRDSKKYIRTIIKHDCSVLPGHSGAPVINLKNGLVIGLHYEGKTSTLKENYAYSLSRLGREQPFREAMNAQKARIVWK